MLLNANDECGSSAECADGMPCEGGRCKGHAEGAACTMPFAPPERPANFGLTNFVCDKGLACALADNGTAYVCRAAQQNNATCNATHPCSIYQVCNVGTCVKPHSVGIGAACNVCGSKFF